jgi:hypothetical protein
MMNHQIRFSSSEHAGIAPCTRVWVYEAQNVTCKRETVHARIKRWSATAFREKKRVVHHVLGWI